MLSNSTNLLNNYTFKVGILLQKLAMIGDNLADIKPNFQLYEKNETFEQSILNEQNRNPNLILPEQPGLFLNNN